MVVHRVGERITTHLTGLASRYIWPQIQNSLKFESRSRAVQYDAQFSHLSFHLRHSKSALAFDASRTLWRYGTFHRWLCYF